MPAPGVLGRVRSSPRWRQIERSGDGHVRRSSTWRSPITPPVSRYTVTEQRRIPLEGWILGFGPALTIAAGAAAVWLLSGDLGALALTLTFDLGLAILLFLSGVRRGLSFRSPEGPTMGQRATFFWLFGLGFVALVLPSRPTGTALVALGFASIGVLDWVAARKEDAPPYFARLRPPQMAIMTLAMVALLLRQVV